MESVDEFGNPKPCDNHDPCKDIPDNTTVFFNDGSGFVECPPPNHDPCKGAFPPPTEPGTIPNFEDGTFTECPPLHDDPCKDFGDDFEPFFENGEFISCEPPDGDPCEELPPAPEPDRFPNFNDGEIYRVSPTAR